MRAQVAFARVTRRGMAAADARRWDERLATEQADKLARARYDLHDRLVALISGALLAGSLLSLLLGMRGAGL